MTLIADIIMWLVINGWKVLLGGVLGAVVMVFCMMYDERYMLGKIKVWAEIIAIMLGVALLTYATIIWIYPKAIEIGILIGG